MHKKDVAEVHSEIVEKLFQPKRMPKNTPKYLTGDKKTVYKKNGRFVKEDTDGAIAYKVDTLGEDKTKVKSALQLKLAEIREKARIKKKVGQEKTKAAREVDEYLTQCTPNSPEFTVPSNLSSPDETILNAVLSPAKSASNATESTSGNGTNAGGEVEISQEEDAKENRGRREFGCDTEQRGTAVLCSETTSAGREPTATTSR